ncbi:MAG: type II secretion system protein [Candidatus Poribacteria bacterium]|nr:type II secretion system protein [Candidatus Poribacteria bacterium]
MQPIQTDQRRSDGGFTLLEILVSLTILGLILPVILYAFTASSRTRAVSDGRTTAAYLARDKMAELESITPIEVGEAQGEFEEGSAVTWATSITQQGELDGLYDCVVTVAWMEAGQQREFSIRTYLADRAATATDPLAQGGAPK